MPEALEPAGAGLSADLEPRSPVCCGLCHLPVVRSWSDPPLLVHQFISGHGSPAGGAVDVFLSDGPCPQEGVPIPPEALDRIPTALRKSIESA